MTKIGGIVGRFQVPELHAGHKAIMQEVASKNDEMFVIIGESPLPTTANNPLPVQSRIYMVKDYLNSLDVCDFRVGSLNDHPDDSVWSQNLDDAILDTLSITYEEVTLYHSRDSFAQYYSGIFPTEHVEVVDITSGTEERAKIKELLPHTEDFRKGVIWANQHRFPTVYSCVDIVAFDLEGQNICLITKEGLGKLQFPGGFTEPDSFSDEEDAVRELKEETGLVNPTALDYAGSLNIDDWRYASEIDVIRTHVFICNVGGSPIAGDDAATANWYKWKDLGREDFESCHQPIYDLLKDLGM